MEEAASAMQEALACARSISDYEYKINALKDISTELAKQGQVKEAASAMQEALSCACGISDYEYKINSLKDISTELAKQGQVEEAASAMQEALACARGIGDEWNKSIALKDISVELAKQGQFEEALACARGINDDYWKSSSLKDISVELAKQGQFEEALDCARGISDEEKKSSALLAISIELAKQGQVEESESVGLEIPQLGWRYECWKQIAEKVFEELGWQKSLQYLSNFQSDEARLFYLKGLTEAIDQTETNYICLQEILPAIVKDSESIETLLQKYAINQLFFGDASKEKINQLNSTLNIQWFLDIHNSLKKAPTATRLSTNLDTWLHEIEDEDDQDQITLWAKQVTKGKITEEEFQTRIKDI